MMCHDSPCTDSADGDSNYSRRLFFRGYGVDGTISRRLLERVRSATVRVRVRVLVSRVVGHDVSSSAMHRQW